VTVDFAILQTQDFMPFYNRTAAVPECVATHSGTSSGAQNPFYRISSAPAIV